MDMPDVGAKVLESFKTGLIGHRRDSFEFDLENIKDPEQEFSRTLVETV